MEENVSLQVSSLFKRLDEAERRSKLLAREVKSIQNQILLLRNSPQLSTNVESIPSTSTSVRRPAEEENGIVQNKRVKPNDVNEKVVVYVDGACENNGKANAKAGIGVWFGKDDPRNISKPVIGRPTNNTAEIQACVAAIQCCIDNGNKNIHIKTDSEFTIKCMTQWIKGWKKKNWRKANGDPVINKTDLEVLDKLCAASNIQWEHVRGHRGIEGNEEADRLARLGAESYRP